MPLAPKAVPPIPLVGGRETKIDPVLVGQDKALDLINYTLSTKGTPARRDAWVALPRTTGLTGLTTQAELFTYGNELLAIDSGSFANSYAPNDPTTSLVNRGRVPFIAVTRDPIQNGTGGQLTPDSASVGGVTCFVWLGTTAGATVTGVFMSLRDETTGALIVSNQLVYASATARPPRVCVTRTTAAPAFSVIYADGTNILLSSFDLNGAVATAAGAVIVTDLVATGVYAISPTGVTGNPGGIDLLVAWECSTGTTSIAAEVFNFGSVAISAQVNAVTTAQAARGTIAAVDLAPFDSISTAVLVARNSGGIVTTAIVAFSFPTLTVTFAAVNTAITSTPVAVTGVLVGAAIQVFASPSLVTGPAVQQNTTFSLSAANVSSAVTDIFRQIRVANGIYGPHVTGRAFASSGVAYVPVILLSAAALPLQDSLFVISSTGELVAAAMYGLFDSGSALLFPAYLSSVPSIGTGVFSVPVVQKGRLSIQNGLTTTTLGIARVLLTFGRSGAYPLWHAAAGQNAFLSGAWLAEYDGAATAEAGFHYFPEGGTATNGAAGNVNGAVQYVSLYEWVDNLGQRYQSAPSIPFSPAANPVNQRVAITAPTLQLGSRAATTVVVWLRTTDGGTTFYRVGSTVNLPGSATVTITENVSDAVLVGNEILYTEGSLPNLTPVNARAICNHQGRLFFSGEDRQEVSYSQLPVSSVGLQFNDALRFRIPLGYGEITAMESMDDKLIILTATDKFVVFGQGPDALGNGGTYSQPAWLAGDTGCIDQRGKVLGPHGLCYQSQHGYYLLDRKLQQQYNDFGASIEGDVLGRVITSAVFLQARSQLRLTIPSINAVLAYDFLFGQWSKFTSPGDAAPVSPVAACLSGGRWTFLDSTTHQIVQDSPGTYLDFGAIAIVGTMRSAWLKLQSISAFQRVWQVIIQGAYAAAGADSSLAITVDINNIFGGPLSYTATFASTLALAVAGTLPQLKHTVRTQKCASIAFTIVDTPVMSAAGGAGVNLSALTLEAAPKVGTIAVPASQST